MALNLKSYLNYLKEWIGAYVKKAHVQGIVLGISGGIDSAVVANIAALNKDIKVIGVWMDIDNSALDVKCVKALQQQNRFKIIEISLLNQFKNQVKLLKLTKPAALTNLKARLRAITLYALAQEHNLLVAGTGNADETYMGYFTKFGDGAADILPIVHLTKRRVFEMAKLLDVPSLITNRAPSASLYKNQTDEGEMGVSYETIDAYLNFKKIKPHDQLIIERYHQVNQHKFNMPIKPKTLEKIRR